MMPTILPNEAPMAMEGTNIPAGTLHPYDTITSPTRMIVASNKEFTMRHWYEVLRTRLDFAKNKEGSYWHKLS